MSIIGHTKFYTQRVKPTTKVVGFTRCG